MAVDRNTRLAMEALPSRGHKGFFRCLNPQKYKGADVSRIVYRSAWELAVMRRFDTDPDILAWASEPIIIPWADPVTERCRRYIPDFMVKRRRPDGVVETLIIEVKPAKESPLHSQAPKRGRKSEKRFIAEVMTLKLNEKKWEAARRYAAAHNMRFIVMTERELFPLRR